MIRLLPLLSVPVIVLAVWAGFAPLMRDLRTQWSDAYGTLSHGYLVFALAAWFCLRAWRSDDGPPPVRAWWPALIPLAALLGVARVFDTYHLGTGRSILLPPLVLSAFALAWGPAAARRLAWPVAFCWFGLAVWYVLNPPLQLLTTAVSTTIVHLIGVPVYVEGNLVHLTAGVFEIASGCAGLNYLLVALTLGATAGTLYVRRWRSRVALLVAAGVAGIVANWARVSSLILIGHATRMQHYLIRVDHLGYGWVVFLVAMVPVAVLLRRLQAREDADPAAGEERSVVPPATVESPLGWSLAALLVACLLLLTPAAWR